MLKVCLKGLMLLLFMYAFHWSSAKAESIDATKYYYNLRNVYSGYYLHGDNVNSGGNVRQHKQWPTPNPTQEYAFFPVSQDIYYVVNRDSGFPLHGDNVNSGGDVRQYKFWPTENRTQLWKIIPVSGKISFYYLQNQYSGYYLHGDNVNSGGNVRQHKQWPTPNPTQMWELKKAGKLPWKNVGKLSSGDASPPNLEGETIPHTIDTKRVLTHRALIPFFSVKDDMVYLTNAEKVQNSPYYLLEKFDFFHLESNFFVDDYEKATYNPNEKEKELQEKITIYQGFTEQQSEEFSKTTGIEVSKGLGVGFKFASANISTKVSHQWGYTSSFTSSITESRSTEEHIYSLKGHVTVVWRPYKEFILKTIDDQEILKWTVDSGGAIYKYFPN